MKKLEIRKYPDPVLRDGSSEIVDFDEKLSELIDDMILTMVENNGVGLAAPQVGVSKRLIVFKTVGEDDEEIKYIINPEIVFAEGSICAEEGCLSLPGIVGVVKRNSHIKVKGRDKSGKNIEYETDKFWAVIIQHEIDHLNGKVFIDRLSTIKRKFALLKYKKQVKS